MSAQHHENKEGETVECNSDTPVAGAVHECHTGGPATGPGTGEYALWERLLGGLRESRTRDVADGHLDCARQGGR